MTNGIFGAYDFGVQDELYLEWIAYVFDRPATPKGWYFDLDPEPPKFEATPSEIVGLIGKTMVRSGADLVEFTNAQVDDGLSYIFSEACSRHSDNFGDGTVCLDLKVAAIRAMKHLYKDCFEPRCDSRLGHIGEHSENPLNYMAYMLWDVTPIPYVNRQVPDALAACVEVLEFALHSSNDACIEGAVHGLGHLLTICRELAKPVIHQFLATTMDFDALPQDREASGLRPIRKELRHYARQARRGARWL